MTEPLDLHGYESGLLTAIRPTIYREKKHWLYYLGMCMQVWKS